MEPTPTSEVSPRSIKKNKNVVIYVLIAIAITLLIVVGVVIFIDNINVLSSKIVAVITERAIFA